MAQKITTFGQLNVCLLSLVLNSNSCYLGKNSYGKGKQDTASAYGHWQPHTSHPSESVEVFLPYPELRPRDLMKCLTEKKC